MKKIIWLLIFVSLASTALGMGNKIIAVVNNEIVTSSDLDSFIKFLGMQLSGKYKGRELQDKINAMLPDVLTRLIEDKLLIQEAKKDKIQVDPNRVKARIDQIKKNYPSESDMLRDLQNNGLTINDIETKVREQLMMYEYVDEKIRSKITVNPQEVTALYNERKNDFMEPQKRRFISIGIDTEEKAKEVLAEINKGKDFKEAAGQFSLEVDDLGLISRAELRQDLGDVVFGMQIGEVSSVVKLDDNFYILKLEEIAPGKEKTLEEAKEEITNMLLEQKMQIKMTELLDELKNKSFIEVKKN